MTLIGMPGGDRLLDRRQALLGRGDLHEQVRAVDELVQALGLGDRALRVVRQVGVDLERDPAVARVLAGLVPDRAQDVAGAADVLARRARGRPPWARSRS